MRRPGAAARANGGRVNRYYDPTTGQFLTVDPLVEETGQPYAYTGDDPVNGTDPLGLCSSNGIFLVPGACHFTSRTWVGQVEGEFQLQKTSAMEGGLAKFWGSIEDFGDTLTNNPLAYCGPGSSAEAGLANFLDFGSALAGGDPELDAEGEEDAVPAVTSGETPATAYGRAAHAAYDYGPGFVKEVTLENGKRADAVNFATREVIELKPNNPRAIAGGLRQAEGYAQQLTQEFPGKPFTYQVVTYDRP